MQLLCLFCLIPPIGNALISISKMYLTNTILMMKYTVSLLTLLSCFRDYVGSDFRLCHAH